MANRTLAGPDAFRYRYLLGLDIGTLGVKGVVVRLDGQVVARQHLDHSVSHPHPGWAEHDANRHWWGDGRAVIQALLAQVQLPPETIVGVGVCGLVPCLCPLDVKGQPLRPAILYADNRALVELDSVNRILGTTLTAQAVIPKLLWLKVHEPGVFAQTQAVLSAHHYVVYRLTGHLAVDYDSASVYGAVFDASAGKWRADVCESLGIPVEMLPQPRPATHVVGQVTRAAAQETGLAPGTPVIAGSGDTFPTIVGAGAVEPGAALISFGTTGLLLLVGRPLEEVTDKVHFGPGPNGESPAIRWAANVLTCGRAVQWFRDRFAPESDYSALDDDAAQVPPGSDGLIALPHFLGRRTPTPDPRARGAYVGLTLVHTSAHLYRALLESFGYALRQGFEPERGQVRRVVATAGGARSRLWRQIVSDILDMPVEYSPQSGGALGIAYLAGYATGCFSDLSTIRNQWLGPPEVTSPHPGARAVYDRLYGVYSALDEELGPQMARLAADG